MKRILVATLALVAALLGTSRPAGALGIDGYIAFDDANTGQIYSVTQLGTNLTQLTHVGDGRFAISPHWSPDAHRIAFVIFSNGFFRMYTMAADGSDVQRVRSETQAWDDDVPAYFPDGKRIVFARCATRAEVCALATVHADGSGLRMLTHPANDVFDFFPVVSPDGTRIAFVRFNANGIHSQVWVMNSDGTGAHPITAPRLEATFPNWSPDGSALSVSSNCCRLGGNLYRLPVNGDEPTQLTTTGYPNFSGDGDYAPSGREIAFVTDRAYPDKCCTDLYLMRADGAHQVKVPLGGLNSVFDVDWGPAPTG